MVSAGSEVSSSKSIAIWSISTGSKPVIEMSRPSSMRSSASSGSSMARRSRSQPAFSAILLSAKSNARFLASLSPSSTITGTSLRPRSFAASRRPCPNRIVLFSSTSDRDHEAEGENAIGDLADLLLRMRPCITGIGLERMRRNPLDLVPF